jgi:surface antigen
MNKLTVTALAGLLTISLGACTNQEVGTVTGGVLGGAIGTQIGGGTGQTIAIIGGTMIGSLIGGKIGKSMDDVDRMKANQALEKTPTNQSTSWSNPDNGNKYTVTPTKTYTNSAGSPCRQYTTTAVIEGKREELQGTACRDANGQWKAV